MITIKDGHEWPTGVWACAGIADTVTVYGTASECSEIAAIREQVMACLLGLTEG